MIGLDTNVLVRYFAQDDPVRSPKATRVMERLSPDEPGLVSIVAIVGTIWVLARAYGLPAREIADIVEGLLQADALVVESEQEVFIAAVAGKDGEGTFSDALVAALGVKAGCARTLAFDRKASRFQGFALLSRASPAVGIDPLPAAFRPPKLR